MIAILDGLARFTKPTAIVWATDDVFFPVVWAEWLERTIPGVVRSVRVEGAQLFFSLERPDDLTNELRQFWSGSPAFLPGAGSRQAFSGSVRLSAPCSAGR